MYILHPQEYWRNQKPALGSQINWGHPLSQGLVGCWLFNEGSGSVCMNLAQQRSDSISSAARINSTGFVTDGTTNAYLNLGDKKAFKISGALTIIMQVKGAGNATYGGGVSKLALVTRGYQCTIVGTTAYAYIAPTSSTLFSAGGDAGIHSDTKWETWALVFRPSTGLYLFKDGAVIASNTSAVPSSQYDGTSNSLCISVRTDSYGGFNGIFKYVNIYNKALSNADVQSGYVEPYQFILSQEPPRTIIDLSRYKEITPESRIAFDNNSEVATAASNPIL